MTEVLRLDVYLHGVPAAVITQAPGGLTLDYLREYVDVFPDLPLSYSLPMTARRHAGDRVRNYLDNLLPDDPRSPPRRWHGGGPAPRFGG